MRCANTEALRAYEKEQDRLARIDDFVTDATNEVIEATLASPDAATYIAEAIGEMTDAGMTRFIELGQRNSFQRLGFLFWQEVTRYIETCKLDEINARAEALAEPDDADHLYELSREAAR